MCDAGDVMRLAIFKRTACLNDYNRILEKDLTIIIIITTMEKVTVITLGIRNEERQTLPNEKAMKHIMQST